MKNDPTDSELELLAALEAEEDPLHPADPALAEKIATDQDAWELAEALTTSREALARVQEPAPALFEQLTRNVMADISTPVEKTSPVQGSRATAEGWGERLGAWFSGLAIRPGYVALAAAALVALAVGIWLVQSDDEPTIPSDEGVEERELADEGAPLDEPAPDKGVDDELADGTVTAAEEPEQMVEELDEALSEAELDGLELSDEDVEPVELAASWDRNGWASGDGFGDYGLDGMSDAELEALDEALADL